MTSARSPAVAPMAQRKRALRNNTKIPENNLVMAFSKLKIKERSAKRIKAVPQASQAPQPPMNPIPAEAPMNDTSIHIDVEKLADQISKMNIAKPTRKPAKRRAAAVHPYGRPVHTKAEKILSNHGIVKKGIPTTPIDLGCLANSPTIKFNNATISLLSNAPPSPEVFDFAVNWSTAWLSSGSATPTSPPTIEAQLYAPPAIGNLWENWFVNEVMVTITSMVKEVPQKIGKTVKPRITTVKKSAPYTKDKAERKQNTVKAEPIASRFDAEVATLADMLSLCEVTKGSRGNARLTRSRALAARKVARHNSGYEGGNEN